MPQDIITIDSHSNSLSSLKNSLISKSCKDERIRGSRGCCCVHRSDGNLRRCSDGNHVASCPSCGASCAFGVSFQSRQSRSKRDGYCSFHTLFVYTMSKKQPVFLPHPPMTQNSKKIVNTPFKLLDIEDMRVSFM